MAIAAAVLAGNAAVNAERARVIETDGFLSRLDSTNYGFTRFLADTKKMPGKLSHLSSPITTADRDLCGSTYNNSAINEWNSRYTDRIHSSTGTPVGIGTANDSIVYIESGGSNFAVVLIPGVSEGTVLRLDARVDTASGRSGAGAGTVRWSAVDAEGLVTAYWFYPTTVNCAGGGTLPTAPAASFSWICQKLVCTFTDQSTDDGTIVSWAWTFGDGGTSTAQNPSHTYAAPGVYTVHLTVTDNTGATGDVEDEEVGAQNIDLTAVAGQRQGTNRPVTLTWTGATSTIDVYRNNVFVITTANDGSHVDNAPGNGTWTYRICETGSQTCSNNSTIVF